jgi:hypothetical protein
MFGSFEVLFPSTPSPVVVLSYGMPGKEGVQGVDLRRVRPLYNTPGRAKLDRPVVSGDGLYLVGRDPATPAGKLTLRILSLADGRTLAPVALDGPGGVLFTDFLGNGRVVTAVNAKNPLFQVWDPATGREVGRYQPGHPFDLQALSPGRAYLALPDDKAQRLEVRRADSGELVGDLLLPETGKGGKVTIAGLAFSPDGEELAALYLVTEAGQATSRLFTWKMATGEPGVAHPFARPLTGVIPDATSYRGPALEWVPDRSGWLLYGRGLIEYHSGALAYTLPRDPAVLIYHQRRLIGPGHLAVVTDTRAAAPRLDLVPLPGAEIAAAFAQARAQGAGAK